VHASGQIEALIKRAAHEAGFELAGIAPARDLTELAYFKEWIAAGRAGEMKYLEARDERGCLKRSSLHSIAPWARSVIVCAINYNTAESYSTKVHDAERGWMSRYAWSREDYHESVIRRLRAVEQKLRHTIMTVERAVNAPADAIGEAASPGQTKARAEVVERTPAAPLRTENTTDPCSNHEEDRAPGLLTRCYVDTGPLVERVYAKYAGVGWIGKNTCILNQKLGSWLFLGVILTSLDLAPDLPAPDRCGTCTRCIDACPTHALTPPYQLDSNLCISYLTIEKRGEIPESLRSGVGRHVFGCDICQDVCPWNRKAPVTSVPEFQPSEGLVNPALVWLAEISAQEFQARFRRSPIRRAKHNGVRRNAIVAMGNSGNSAFLPLLRKLADDEDPVIAESARWSAGRLQST
jgi:epoxyqueuosine reductase